MTIEEPRLYRTGAFAKKAGVTIRTLRFYDKQGLLSPTEYTESGQRLYSEKDLGRLQQILTLKFIGLSLGQVSKLLTDDPKNIAYMVGQQKQVIVDRILQLQHLIHALDRAESTWKDTQSLNWDQFAEIIKAVNLSKRQDRLGVK